MPAFAIDHPELLQLANELAASSDAADGFLETPALVLAARDLAQEEPSFPEGTLIGPYRIVALLARGGMGDVYRANDPRLGRDIAVKTLTNTERGDAQSIERFLQEARITASLDHPNIVKVFDVGMSNGRPYLVSELLDGEALRVPIGRGPASEEDARRIACAVTSGLVAAHARGLVHRDLKPENIFVTRTGTAKILDFGIAKLVQDPALPRAVATLTGMILGTAGYLAPEQVKGEPVDPRTDLFALGSILFELMTGQRAFAREHTVDTLHAIVHDDPPDLLPRGSALTTIVKRLLAKAPEDRFQSAADLAVGAAAGRFDRGASENRRASTQGGRRFLRPERGWAIAGVASVAMVWRQFLGGGCANAHSVRRSGPASRSSRGRFRRALDSIPRRSSPRTGAGSRSRPSAAVHRRACSCDRSIRLMPRPWQAPKGPSSRSGRPTERRSGSLRSAS